MFERAIDGRDLTRGNTGISCGRVQLGMSKKRLDVTDRDALLEQLCRERVAKRMQADPLGDACRSGGLVEDATQLAIGKMLPLTTTGEQPALFHRHVRVKECRAPPPPLPQRLKQLFRPHDVPILR